MARHVLKVLFVFSPWTTRRLEAATLPAYLASVPLYRFQCAHFRLEHADLAGLVGELARSGAVKTTHGWITAA